jgi:tetratricopeptide (TPR) repeat protein
LQIYLEDKVTQPIALLYLKLAEVYEGIYQEQNKPSALETAIEDYQLAQVRADELKQKDTFLTAQIQLGGLYVKAYRQSGEQKYYENALAILNGIDSSIEKNEGLLALLQENFGQAYYARYERTKEKDRLVKAQDYLQKAFDFAVSKNNLAKWMSIAPILSLVYFQLRQKVDWNKIWDFGLQSLQGISRSSDTHYTDRVASVIADSARIAFEKGEHGFALQQLVAISGYFERAGLETPGAVHLALENLRIELGDERFALLYAGAQGRLSSGIAVLLEESRTLMGNQQFDSAAHKLGDALNLLVDDGKEEYKRQKATILFLRGLCLREQQLWEFAILDQEQAFELYATLKDLVGQAHVLLEIGYLYEFMNSYEDARLHYTDAYRLYKKVDEKKGLASAAEHLGTLEFRVRMYPQAVENLEKARKLYIELGERDKASSLDADIIDAKAGLREQGINLEESHD